MTETDTEWHTDTEWYRLTQADSLTQNDTDWHRMTDWHRLLLHHTRKQTYFVKDGAWLSSEWAVKYQDSGGNRLTIHLVLSRFVETNNERLKNVIQMMSSRNIKITNIKIHEDRVSDVQQMWKTAVFTALKNGSCRPNKSVVLLS
jgi:hypothetical protein